MAHQQGRADHRTRRRSHGGAHAASERAAASPRAAALRAREAAADPEHFFDLESIEDPQALLDRATELTLAFRAATDRAVEFQAMAAAQLADPRRFDRLTPAEIAERAEWTEDYAKKMVEFGRELLRGADAEGYADPV